jgi:hypothetical protein
MAPPDLLDAAIQFDGTEERSQQTHLAHRPIPQQMVEIQRLVQIQLPPGVVARGEFGQAPVVHADLLDDAEEGKVLGHRVAVLRREGVQLPGLLATQASSGPPDDERHGAGAAAGGNLRRQDVPGGGPVARAGDREGRDGIHAERYGPQRSGEKIVRRHGRRHGRSCGGAGGARGAHGERGGSIGGGGQNARRREEGRDGGSRRSAGERTADSGGGGGYCHCVFFVGVLRTVHEWYNTCTLSGQRRNRSGSVARLPGCGLR